MLAAGAITAIKLTGGRDAGRTGGGTSVASGYSTRPAVCRLELNVALDVYANYDAMTLVQAIGTSSPIFTLSGQIFPKLEGLASRVGSGEAENEIAAPIRQACDTAQDPILTQTQLTALSRLATPGDAHALNEVTIYSTGPDGH